MIIDNYNKKKELAYKLFKILPRNGIIGVGSGTTCEVVLTELSKQPEIYKNWSGIIATSSKIEKMCQKINLKILNNVDKINFSFDSCDYYTKYGNMLKGKGGALFREKLMANNTDRYVILATKDKLVKSFLGLSLVVEISTFLSDKTFENIRKTGLELKYRKIKNSLSNFITDNNNYILDCILNDFTFKDKKFKNFINKIKLISGVIEVGYFTNLKPEFITL